ncbi:hypothetical protein F2P81_014802 [Scophthalmus maximus]|uniref:Uncharacterized protein n=1 Tax=Scophthalmus maximus TaxID=52904 RepID=A0A6A4SQA2_SCOMX|nr:hypothetical protein F2P81_014802 [Scophthalmus maximus]
MLPNGRINISLCKYEILPFLNRALHMTVCHAIQCVMYVARATKTCDERIYRFSTLVVQFIRVYTSNAKSQNASRANSDGDIAR